MGGLLSRRIRQTLVAMLIATVALGAMLSHPVVLAFGVMAIATGTVSLLWNRLSLQELSYERLLPEQSVFKGEEIPLTLALSNRKPVPLAWVRLEDEVPDALEVIAGDEPENIKQNVQTLHHSASIKWYERLRWRYRLRCNQRGLYRIGPARIESGDPFGFFRSRRSEPLGDSVLVYPQVFSLEELGIPSMRPMGDALGGRRIFQDPSRPSGIREYQRGDPLKMVDWKATARSQQLQVRTYEPTTSMTAVLVVAVDTREPYWDVYDPRDLERVITVSASMAGYAADREYAMGLFTNDMPVQARRPLVVPPARGREQLGLVLGALATVRPYAFRPMGTTLAEHSNRFPLGATLVVATAYLPPEFLGALRDVTRHGHKVTVLYVGKEPCPDIGEGVLVYELRDRLIELEQTSEPIAS